MIGLVLLERYRIDSELGDYDEAADVYQCAIDILTELESQLELGWAY